jgi:SAM-dependent methyltransferase
LAHIEVNSFINHVINSIEPFYKHSRVLEIGSYDVNGSVRSNFKDASEYVGVDLVPGPSVDVVTKGHLYRNEAKFDIVLSVESFEHNSDWIETFDNMIKLTDDDGIVIFTCATYGRLEHGTYRTDPLSSPGTSSKEYGYYRNLGIKDFTDTFSLSDKFVSYGFYINHVKIDANAITDCFKNATEVSTQIRKKKNFKSYLKIRFLYSLLSPLYIFLSDGDYQKITYLPYKKIRNIVNSFSK